MADVELRAPDGRTVILTAERWRHIVGGHPELAIHRDAVLAAVTAPARHLPGRRQHETWSYGPGGPSRFIKVVVHWTGDRGTIVTAFARRRFP
jgi:hypothetical protein